MVNIPYSFSLVNDNDTNDNDTNDNDTNDNDTINI